MKTLKYAGLRCLWYAALPMIVCACNSSLDIQHDYSFDLVTMPVAKQLVQGEAAEIRCEIVAEGEYDGAKYFIRYFQPDGRGELRLDGTLFAPNDNYPLRSKVFRLYYTSRSTDQQTIDVYISDNFGNLVVRSFTFNIRSDSDTKIDILPFQIPDKWTFGVLSVSAP